MTHKIEIRDTISRQPGSNSATEARVRQLTIEGPVAVFSDVHGNLPALEAVLDDIEARELRHILCLGDLVGYGPFPNEVAALVRRRAIPCLMGNYDQDIGFETGDCGCAYKTDEQRAESAASLAWTQTSTNDKTKAFLRTLDDHFVLDTAQGQILAVHGSPRRINESSLSPGSSKLYVEPISGCDLAEGSQEDCFDNPTPVCGDCLRACGIVRCT